MTPTVSVQPGEGRRVRHPATAAVIEGPVDLPRDTWLIRRLADGDLVLVHTDDAAPTAPKEKKAR